MGFTLSRKISTAVVFSTSLVFAVGSQAKTGSEVLEDYLSLYKTTYSAQKSANQYWADNSLEQCSRDEFEIFEMENTLIKPWKDAWRSSDQKMFSSLILSPTAATISFPTLTNAKNQINGIQVFNWEPKSKPQPMLERFAEFKEVIAVDIDIVDYTIASSLRNSFSQRFDNAQLLVQVQINGIDKNGARRSDRGQFDASVIRVGGTWKLAELKAKNGETLVSNRAPAFAEITSIKGLAKLPTYQRTEAIRRGGYALSVADVNGDGFNDMLVGMRESLVLLAGDKHGNFSEVTGGSGLEKLKYVKTAIFADFENRGVQDLVITMLRPENIDKNKGHTSVMAFRGDGKGHFEKKNIDFGSKKGFLQPMPAAVGDFNNDGYLDLYVGYPGLRDFTSFELNNDKREVQGLYINDGKGGFHDFTDQFNQKDYAGSDKLFPHASLAVNFDQQGGIDLLVADDRNNLSPVYSNNGKGVFKQVAKEIGLGNNGYGMSMAAGDINNDGITDIAWTNVNLNASQRANSACLRHWGRPSEYSDRGLRLFKGTGKGKFQEITVPAKIATAAGQGAAGLTFIDYDNDGLTDIYLTNGLWSGSKNGQDLGTIFNNMAQIKGGSMTHLLKPEDTLGFKDVLAQFEGKVQVADYSVVKRAEERPSLAGYQTNKLFRNNGDSTFTEVGFFEGVDSIADGYVVGTVTNPDGRLDLVLRNGDPGTKKYQFPVVQYFRNNFPNNAKSVILTFESRSNNRDAVGTFVVAVDGKRKQVQHLTANNGSLQNERAIHFGIGQNDKIPMLEIHWASGAVQTVRDVLPGRHHFIEQAANKVSQN